MSGCILLSATLIWNFLPSNVKFFKEKCDDCSVASNSQVFENGPSNLVNIAEYNGWKKYFWQRCCCCLESRHHWNEKESLLFTTAAVSPKKVVNEFGWASHWNSKGKVAPTILDRHTISAQFGEKKIVHVSSVMQNCFCCIGLFGLDGTLYFHTPIYVLLDARLIENDLSIQEWPWVGI